jgi:uncharacterized cupin superfamily protein
MLTPFAVAAADLALEPSELDPAQILGGTPQTADLVLWESADGRIVRGVWEITPGVVTDVEFDELFVVLSGRATIEIEGAEPVEVGPGSVSVLGAGAKTTWTVHETLRKVYQITYVPGADEAA